MPAFKACTNLYELVRERWPEITAEISVVCATVKLTFPSGVTLMIRPVRVLASKYEKVSFMFGDIEKIISFDWRNNDGKIFECKGNPQLSVEPLNVGCRRQPFECSGNHCHFAPNALISTSRKKPNRVCAIDYSTLHLHYYPHEMEDMCAIIDAVFRCTDNNDYAPLRSIAAHHSTRPPKGPETHPASDEWRRKWVRR